MHLRFESGKAHKCLHSANRKRYGDQSNIVARQTMRERVCNAINREAQRPGAWPSAGLRKVRPVRHTVLSSVLSSSVPANLEIFLDIAGQDEISKAEIEETAENR